MEASSVKVKHPELDAQELTVEMRTATLTRAGAAPILRPAFDEFADESTRPSPPELPEVLDLELRPAFKPSKDDEYEVGSFMQLYDLDFVEAAYRAILRREPDAHGFQFYLHGLRSGRLDRLDVIVSLRESDEGKRHQVNIKGLTLPLLMRRLTSIPLIGYPVRVGLDLLRLPILIRRLQTSMALAHSRQRQIADHVSVFKDGWTQSFATLTRSVDDQSAAIQALADSHAALDRKIDQLRRETDDLVRTQTTELANEFNSRLMSMLDASQARARETVEQLRQIREQHSVSTQYSEREIANLFTNVQQLRRELALQRAGVAVLEDRANESPSPIEQTSAAVAHGSLDALYVELEDRFRGSPEDVRESMKFYLPYVQSAPNANLPIVDLGCGRGEWLQLLQEAGCKALGVDTNRVMVDVCRERGLDVIERDSLSYLRGLSNDSVRGVTGFHLAEHLPAETLMLLLDQIMRALHPGGFVVFETPNPDNLFVSSNYFYFDPSHRHPLPSGLMKFFLESRGFQRVEMTPLHPCDEGRFKEVDDVSKRLNELFYGPMDYAIVGWKVDR